MSTKKNSTANTTPAILPAPAAPAITPAPAMPAAINPPPPPPPLVTGTANAGNHGTKVDLQAMYQAVIAGLLAYYQPGDQFLMKAGTFTRDELVGQFQGFVMAAEKTKADNQVWRQDIQSERELELTVKPLRAGVRGIVQARFGKGGAQLLQFGFPPAKPAVRTAASKLLAAQKAKATREARGTKGAVAKLDVTGTVASVTVNAPAPGTTVETTTATTTAPAAAPVPAPAPAAPAAAEPAAQPAQHS